MNLNSSDERACAIKHTRIAKLNRQTSIDDKNKTHIFILPTRALLILYKLTNDQHTAFTPRIKIPFEISHGHKV